MNFLDEIKSKTIIVCPYQVKNKLLEDIDTYNRLINVKIYTLDELKKYIYFDYDERAILYLMEEKEYSYEVSKNYIENLYYVEDKKYNNEKLDFLVALKKELIDKELLILNNYFLLSNKSVPFIVFGYDYLTNFDKKLLSNFEYKVIDKEEVNNRFKIHKFNTLEDEVLFVAQQIIDLINKGININDISIINLDGEYNKVIIRIFKMFNIPVDIDNSSSLLSTSIGNKTIKYLEESKSFEDTIKYLKEISDTNSTIYSEIINIFNKYVTLDYSFNTKYEAIKYDFMNTSIANTILDNKVRVDSLSNSIYKDSEYVFLIGFNQGSIPKIYKDEDYISDKLKDILGLNTVNDINRFERSSALNNIKAIKNLTISYKTNYLDKEYYLSNLLQEYEEIDNDVITTNSSYEYSLLKLSFMLDELLKYDKKNDELGIYFNSFNINYMGYDNKFKGIKKESLLKYLNNKITLSYSTIDTFFKCQFRYYIENILKLNKYEETFDTLIGSLFHYVLSHVYNEDFDLDRDYEYYLKDKELSIKEKFYIDKLKKELVIICNRLKDFYNDTGLTSVFTEKRIIIDKSTDIEAIFKGIVDKIMYKEYDGKTLLAIVDYKTGNADIDIYNSAYGIGMQLLIYLYLISKSDDLFDNYSCVGFYLQKILSNEVNIEKDKTYLDIKYNNLKLFGYSTDDVLSLQRFDPTYENSAYIKSLKTTKTGFYAYSKVISEDTMKDLVDLVDKKIDEARDKIINADFSINPKWISDDKDLTGCLYCKYYDICNRKNEDIVNLTKYKDLSFLKEGDINA